MDGSGGVVSSSNPNARESLAIHPAYDSHVAAVCRLTGAQAHASRRVGAPPAPQDRGTTICGQGLAPSAENPKWCIMRPLAIVGLVLIFLGIAGLVVGHFSITTEKKVVDLGPLTASVDEKHSIYVPDIAGVCAVAAGLVLVVASRRRT